MADNQTREETAYTDQGPSQSAFAEETVIVEKSGSKGRFIMVGAAAFLLLMVGLFAFNAYRKSTTPSMPADPQAQAVANPAADVPPALAPPDPAAPDPNAAPIDPLVQGQPVAPPPTDAELFGTPAGQPIGVDPLGQPIFQDPNQQMPPQPANPGANPGMVDANGQPIQQMPLQPDPATPIQNGQNGQIQPPPVQVTVQPMAPPSPTNPPTNQAATNAAVSALDQVRSDIMTGFDELRKSIENLAVRQSSFETSTNQRFDTIESRLSGVEAGRPVAPASSARRTDAPSDRVASSKPKSKSRPRAAPKPKPRIISAPAPSSSHHNTFEIIAPHHRSTVIMPTGPAVLVEQRQVYAPAPSVSFCPPSAVQPGMFWVRQADGSFLTYGEGDRLAGGTITKIDPTSGIFVDGAMVCAGR